MRIPTWIPAVALALAMSGLVLSALPQTQVFLRGLFPPKVSGEEAYRRAGQAEAAHDPATQFYWMKIAAEHKYPQAENDLGYLYSTGTGVAADDKEAFGWFVKGAQDANATAQYNLGLMYKTGRGIDRRDLNAAQVWYQAAADNRYEPATKALREVASLKAREAAEQRQQADAMKTAIIAGGTIWLLSKLLSNPGGYGNHGSGGSSAEAEYGWSTPLTDMSLPQPSRPDTSIGCAWGDQAYGTCH